MFARPITVSTVVLVVMHLSACGRVPETAAQHKAEASEQATPPPRHSTYAVAWVDHDAPAALAPGESIEIKVSVRNLGDWIWPNPLMANPSNPSGGYSVRLTYRWIDEAGAALPQGPARAELRKPVAPGDTARFAMLVTSPQEPGSYQLQFDLVEELVVFFSTRGADKLLVPVTVQ